MQEEDIYEDITDVEITFRTSKQQARKLKTAAFEWCGIWEEDIVRIALRKYLNELEEEHNRLVADRAKLDSERGWTYA